ncbi:MAG TPA: tetratricopeptide repeat protein [Burkholderiales bacterium]|nr:tetratricopeptide repeat protein [Burkholderiales bacterium]
MSLLLEALKKAEKAKEEAQRRARADTGGTPSELRLEGEAAPAADAKPIVTRPELPDISQPLEIVSDDVAKAPAPEQRAAPQPSPAPPPRPQAAPRDADPRSAERAAAKKVFEAKFKEPNPRMSFYITMGVLGLFAVGTAGYFWYQLRPPPGLINANPPRPGGEAVVAAAETAAPLKPVTAPTAQAPIPGLPGSAALPSPTPAPAARTPAAASSPAETVAVPKPAARPLTAPPARLIPDSPLVGAERSTALTVARPLPQVHAKVESGYAAYLAGDLAAARADYQEVLREEPTNRDALLGLAAVDMRSGRYEPAEAIYLRLLQSDPRDAHAHAALIALRAGRMDPVAAESRVKSLLANDPAADVLYFTLGNQLALQGRWAEAQQHYFKAFAADPDNADFAYNLAVSLDHLRQSRLALEYYRRAIALAERRGGSFELDAARSRVQQLGR